MKFNDNKASDRAQIASLFADFFETVYIADDSSVISDPLAEIDKCVDIGTLSYWITLDSNMNFNRHIEFVIAKAFSMLGFIKRICYKFRDVRALKSIYCAHVKSHLEYASVVWQSHCANRMNEESIQKQLVLYALRRTVARDENSRLPSYESRCKVLGIDSLKRKRINLSAYFVFDLLTNRIDALELRSQVVINEPVRRLREHQFLTVNYHRTNYGYYEPVNMLCVIFNSIAHLFNATVSRSIFRNRVQSSVLPDVMAHERYVVR